MSKRAPNQPIGEVACPHKTCDKTCKVYKFAQRTPGRVSVFTGKMYADCPTHGRFGNDGNAAMQEYIVAQGKIWGDHQPAKPVEAPGTAQPSQPKAAPAPQAAAPAPTTDRGWRPLID